MDKSRKKLNIVLLSLVCSITLPVGSFNAAILPIVKKVAFEMVDIAVVDVLQRCFVSESFNTVVFAGDASPILIVNTTFTNSLPVVLIEKENAISVGNSSVTVTVQPRLPVFVMIVSERYSAQQLFPNVKISGWWNYEGTHIMLVRSTSSRNISCPDEARESLLIAWKMNVISSVFLCTMFIMKNGQQTESVFAYTFNPYKQTAPLPWKMVETRIGPEGHPWTLFEQPYELGKTSCQSLKFEGKTMDLNGFKISAIVKPEGQEILDSGSKEFNDLRGSVTHIHKAIWKQLNASISLKIYESTYGSGLSLQNGTTDGMIADLVHNECDVILNLKYVMSQWNICFTSVMSTTGLSLVTYHRGLKTPLMKIVDFLKFYIILAVILMCIATVIMTSYSKGNSKSPDFMEALRLLLSFGLLRIPRSDAKRLVIFMALLLVLVINSMFQGHLAVLVTVPSSQRQVDTVTDVEELDYVIYGFQFLSAFIPSSLISRYYDSRREDIGYCDVLMNDSNSACLVEASQLYTLVDVENLHISKKSLFTFYQAFTTRMNWPLYDRFNTLVMRCFEGGLMHHWSHPEIEKLVINSGQDEGFRVMNIEDLSFAFEILGAGILLSTVVFVIELLLFSRK